MLYTCMCDMLTDNWYYYYAGRGDPVQQATPDTVTGIYLVIQLAIIASGLC